MEAPANKPGSPPSFIARQEIVSRPGAKVIVTRIHLTQAGRDALTSGSTGITTGVSMNDALFGAKRQAGPA